MKLRVPKYYKEFKCIADKCKNSCCSAGWEIDIDDKTAEIYKNVDGAFGDKLKENIEFKKPSHFVLNKNGTCPFFNKCGLCDIYINLGEDKLCQICTDHPRFYEWFDGVKEAGIGLCCEEAARIILSQDRKFGTCEIGIADEECDEYDDDVYEYLLSCRNKVINYLDDDTIDLEKKLKNVLWFGYMTQVDLDSGLLDDEEIVSVDEIGEGNCIADIIDFLCGLEPNDNQWIPYLKHCLSVYKKADDKMVEFENEHPEVSCYIKNIAIYFVWRYFLKGVYDCDVVCKLKLMYVSCFVIRWLMYCYWLENGTVELCDCVEIVKRFSEEIEYSDENLERFWDGCYELDLFSVENLIDLI